MVKSFHIKSGGISYPFSIKFYYVVKQRDQVRLLQLIDEFFTKIPQKQRVIRFYEAENWITTPREGGILQYKGEEVLLLEKVVK